MPQLERMAGGITVNEKTRDSLLNYRGEKELEDWTGERILMQPEKYKELLDESNMGEIQAYTMMIKNLLGQNSEIVSTETIIGNDFDPTDGDVIRRTQVAKQLEWLASLDEMGPNNFSIVSFANDRDGIHPLVTWMVFNDKKGERNWEPLGVNNRLWQYVVEDGMFANKDEDGDPLIPKEDAENNDWWPNRLNQFLEEMEKETGVLGFVVSFTGPSYSELFSESLNWKEWPEILLSE
jgi:hypothetical protein